MEEIVQAIILGIVQGLTEFLPVSSSGHLELGKVLLGFDGDGSASMFMTVALHAATALSTVVVFWKDIVAIFRGVCRREFNDETKFVILIAVSMIPAALVGVLGEDHIARFFERQILLVGIMLLVTGCLLLLADRSRDTTRSVHLFQAILIGVAQAIAILPGISRSGATISTSVLLGIDRTKAARFSFLMVVPLILGKMVLDLASGEVAEQREAFLPILFGFVAAFFTGLLACKWMIALVKKCKLWIFSFYCFAVGLLAILWHVFAN